MAVHAESVRAAAASPAGSDASRRRFAAPAPPAASRPTSSPARHAARSSARSPARAAPQTLLAGRSSSPSPGRCRVPLRAVRARGPARVGERRQRGAAARPHLPRASRGRCSGCSPRMDVERARRRRVLRRARLRRGGRHRAARARGSTAHRTPRPAPAHADRRLRRSSPSRLAERIQRHPELGLAPDRLHRRRRHDGARPRSASRCLGGARRARAT